MRQRGLIDNADRRAVGVEPDAAEVLAVNLHGPLINVRSSQNNIAVDCSACRGVHIPCSSHAVDALCTLHWSSAAENSLKWQSITRSNTTTGPGCPSIR